MKIYSQEALVSAIVRSPRPITLLVGSAFTLPDETSIGVPGVKEIISKIQSYIESINLKDEYEAEANNVSESMLYQHGFEFISGWDSQDAVNNIINNAVKEAFDSDNNCWGAPKGVVELCDLLSSGNGNIKTILTTNFDPLIQKRLSVLGKNCIQIILDSDGALGNISSNDPDELKIVHLHGFWENINTLHTQSQLKSSRPLLKSSLIDLLSDTTLIVIGYGGWDDIFIEALESATYESKIDVNVYWAFYEDDHLKIKDKNEGLFVKLSKFISQGRFKAYSGIDCKDIFGEVSKKKIDVTPAFSQEMVQDGDMFSHVVEQHFLKGNNQSSVKNQPLKPYKLIHSKAHERIRTEERKTFVKWSGIEQVIAINQGIGMGGGKLLI